MKLTETHKTALKNMFLDYLVMGDSTSTDEDCREALKRCGVDITIEDILGDQKIDDITKEIRKKTEEGMIKRNIIKHCSDEFELSITSEIKNKLLEIYKEELEDYQELNKEKLIEAEIKKAVENKRLKLTKGKRPWHKYIVSITELVWPRNNHDGYQIDVYDKNENYLARVTI